MCLTPGYFTLEEIINTTCKEKMKVEQGYEPLAGVVFGEKYGRLTPIKRSGKVSKSGNIIVECICRCGKSFTTTASNIRTGKSRSCGCLHKERFNNTTHGFSKTKEHSIWKTMRQRCLNKNNVDYRDYGGRGISVCKEWDDFLVFYKFVGDIPEGMSLDRIDNDGDYCPENCRLAKAEEQANNKRTSVYITYNNERKTIAQWARAVGLNGALIGRRWRDGWSPEDTLCIKPKLGGHYANRSR